jgi:hypothetical protein
MKPETESVLQKIEACDADLTDESVALALEEAADEWERNARHLSMKGVAGAPDWMQFERRLWALGESLRLCFVKRKRWRSWSNVFNVAARCAIDPRFHKGRQSLILLLGHFAAEEYAEILSQLVEDEEVRGHALMALRTGKIVNPRLTERVTDLAAKERGWVRAEAKKYLRVLEASLAQNP